MKYDFDLSIVIVNYNTKELCRGTIEAIFKTVRQTSYEIIVADNSSRKDGVYRNSDSRVKVFGNLPNKGFGTASNYGARHALGRYILFLNSDTVVGEGTIDTAVSYIKENPDIGCLGIRTLLEDGTFDHGCKRGFPTPLNAFCYFMKLDRLFPKNKKIGGYRLTYIKEDETADVDSVSGAFMLMPAEVFEETGGFDESIFMHGEDLDLCFRIKSAGKRVVYLGSVSMVHLKGKSTRKSDESIRDFYKGITYVYDKYYKDKHGVIGSALLHTAIDFKCRLAIFKQHIENKKLN